VSNCTVFGAAEDILFWRSCSATAVSTITPLLYGASSSEWQWVKYDCCVVRHNSAELIHRV
jgi:hypothetical protein